MDTEKHRTHLQDETASAPFNYKRRKSHKVNIGNLTLGGEAPIRIQSMANTDTNDTKSSVEQCIRIIEAGGELVRFTAQGVKEATNLNEIRQSLRERGYTAPLVADIHFNPSAGDTAAHYVEKVRINPGNFVDSVHTNKRFEYTDEEYQQEIEKIKNRLIPFLNTCKEHHTAIRIGVNHGSLSDRILSRYGDTSQGMVESCMEFLRICRDEEFSNIVISIKASNTVVMVQTVRLLAATMKDEGMEFPLHLGVTEAGDGEDGRIKSAVGIGALLNDGIGDTIRVSLSEAPECEIPVAQYLAQYVARRANHPHINATDSQMVNPFVFRKRETLKIGIVGGNNLPVVIANQAGASNGLTAEFHLDAEGGLRNGDKTYPLFSAGNADRIKASESEIKFLRLTLTEADDQLFGHIDDKTVFIIETNHINGVGEQRAFFHLLMNKGIRNPVIIKRSYKEEETQKLQIMAGADTGMFFIDGLGDGLWIEDGNVSHEQTLSIAFGILQAARARVSKTEYISCPSCGRTLYDMQSTIAEIKAKTSHLKGLKIGIMGCIVNGPGEMADADYGYVGSARGKVNLYKGQTCVEKLIPQDEAVEKLIQLIKKNGDWK